MSPAPASARAAATEAGARPTGIPSTRAARMRAGTRAAYAAGAMRAPSARPPARPAAAKPAARSGPGRAARGRGDRLAAFLDLLGRAARDRHPRSVCRSRGHRSSRGSCRSARPGRRRARCPSTRSSTSSRTACSRCRRTSAIAWGSTVGRCLRDAGTPRTGLAARPAPEHEPAGHARGGSADRDGRALRLARDVLDGVGDAAAPAAVGGRRRAARLALPLLDVAAAARGALRPLAFAVAPSSAAPVRARCCDARFFAALAERRAAALLRLDGRPALADRSSCRRTSRSLWHDRLTVSSALVLSLVAGPSLVPSSVLRRPDALGLPRIASVDAEPRELRRFA